MNATKARPLEVESRYVQNYAHRPSVIEIDLLHCASLHESTRAVEKNRMTMMQTLSTKTIGMIGRTTVTAAQLNVYYAPLNF